MPVIRHLHTLRKVRGTKGTSLTFMCNDPLCSWKQPAKLIEGKLFKCNYCNDQIIYGPAMARTRFPLCKNCVTPRKGAKIPEKVNAERKNQDSVLGELLGDFGGEDS